LAERVGNRGGLYATHARHRVFDAEDGVREAIKIAEESGARLQVSHMTPRVFARHLAESVLTLCDEAKGRGLDLGFDIYPYEWGPGPMYELLPGWALEGSAEEVVQRFGDPRFREKVRREHRRNLVRWVQLDRWDKIVVVGAPNDSDAVGKSLAQLAEERQRDPWDVVFDLLAGAGVEYGDVSEIAHSIDWEDILLTVANPSCSLGSDSTTLSRTGPLGGEKLTPGCYGFVPRVFDEFVKTRKVLSFEEAVRRLTSLPASQLGLWDRGIIRPGLVADLCVIDPEEFRDNTTWTDFNARPSGLEMVLIAGKLVVKDGHLTGVRAGHVLRRKEGML